MERTDVFTTPLIVGSKRPFSSQFLTQFGLTEETTMPNGPTPEKIPEPVGDPLPPKLEPDPLPHKPESNPNPVQDPQAIISVTAPKD
jgi:hypothetical protein